MLNFTVGPVRSPASVLSIGAQDCPYFRTEEFSDIMLENESLVNQLAHSPEGSRSVFLTGSGTAAMEAAVVNVLTSRDRALVVNGGSFGDRFCQLCKIHEIPYDVIELEPGRQLRQDDIEETLERERRTPSDYTAFVVNVHETSTGVHYDLDLISTFCRRNGLLCIADAISSFLADDFDMASLGVDVMIAGSQKAMACPPGVSVVLMGPRALDRVNANNPRSMYLNLKVALENQDRGQTPFTPAVGILLQINTRLREIVETGGCAGEISRIAAIANDFRRKIVGLPLVVASECMSNAVTPLHPTNGMSAYDVFLRLKSGFGIWICPNGGELKDKIFRVGHLGCLTQADNDVLVRALRQVMSDKAI